MSEEIAWESRKSAVRAKYLETLQAVRPIRETEDEALTTPETPGSAPTTAATAADPSASADLQRSPTTGTSATVTAPLGTPASPSASSMPVGSTNSPSEKNMAWMVPPTGFIESNLRKSIVGPNGSLVAGLAAPTHASLLKLATARSEAPEDIVWQIAEFFVDAEDERAEGPLADAVEFYMTNYVAGL